MSKWYGKIGFSKTAEYEKGAWEENTTERYCYGDIISNHWKRENSGGVNDDINLSIQISIVADPYILQHCSSIIYVDFMGEKWKVTDVEPQYPRMILNIGGVYHGNTTRATE